jgi:alpha-amylase/alpha-mannosidase (GH57 family)
MKKIWILNLLLMFSIIMSGCAKENIIETVEPVEPTIEVESTQVPTDEPKPEDALYLNLIWHQHQPLYYKDDNGVYTRPWVRAHATKDYYDMASVVALYPDVKVTFNITPVLMKQLDDFSKNGAIDRYWELALIPANNLTYDEKIFILQRFYDANWEHIIDRFPRYKELREKRGGTTDEAIQIALTSFSEQDFRDLQIWFNLAWFDPDFLAEEPLKSLVERGENFSETDKKIVFSEVSRIIGEVIPLHRKLQNNGQIEVITTPYAHPILPLLIDTSLANVGNPSAETPTKFSFPQDALVHLEKSVEMYEDHYGQLPKGLWPGEGAVAQTMVPFVIKAGYQWMATGEPVLAKSLGLNSFSRNSAETVLEADLLYRPYYVMNKEGEKLAVFFRDGVISDKVGFTYSGVSGTAAAKDLMARLEKIREELGNEEAQGPHIVSIVLDGENAWENYENDGKEFFHSFYQLLSESKTIKSITPSEYLDKFPEQRVIDDLFAGAWFSPNYDTWIGEREENIAWDYLGMTRALLAKYNVTKVRQTSPEALMLAEDYMYLAEGSDWFWWYGADQDSGQDSYFDEGFRALLRKVYETLGEPVPSYVNIPIIQAKPIAADTSMIGLSTAQIDGKAGEDEWASAGVFAGNPENPIQKVRFMQDLENLYFAVDMNVITDGSGIKLYFKSPHATAVSFPFSRTDKGEGTLLGIGATILYEWNINGLSEYISSETGWQIVETPKGEVSSFGNTVEISIPLSTFGELETGDEIQFIVINAATESRIPSAGPGQLIVPDLGLSTLVFEVLDPESDDIGPGTYTYPTDAVFLRKAFDLKSFKVSYDDMDIIFKIDLFGPITNPWGSPNNLAIQTLDIYIDQDPGASTGARKLLPGRNLSLGSENGWDFAFWAEGWTPQILTPNVETLIPEQITEASFKLIVDPGDRSISVRIPKDVLGDGNPAAWGYAIIMMGQEGYPATGVWRIRDVEPDAAQWRFGGAPVDTNHTRVIDMLWPEDGIGNQVEFLSTYVSSDKSVDELAADDYAIIPLILP